MSAPPAVPEPRPPGDEPAPRCRGEAVLVVLIALHSAAVGLAAMFATAWGVRLGGFADASPLFFPRQVGVFHLVVACAYLVEYFRYRGVAILLTTKAIGVAFLCAMMAIDTLPWVVPFSAAADGLMWIAVFVARRGAGRRGRPPGAGGFGRA